MKTLILYKSKYGTTKDYADWIHNKTKDSKIFSTNDFDTKLFENYDTIILGSSTYMGQISARRYLETNWEAIKHKRVFLFAVGLVAPDDEASKKSYEMIPEEIRNNIKYVKLPGRIDIKKLKFLEKAVMKITGTKASVDNVDFKKAEPIVEFAQSNTQSD